MDYIDRVAAIEGGEELVKRNRRDFKRDKVYGMCAISRRKHREADKRRWHRAQTRYVTPQYSPTAHLEAYAKALNISLDDATARAARQREALQ